MAARRSPAGEALTELILKTFRLNGALLAVADQLTRGSGLTAARWQVLGAVLREPLTVSGVARSMGLTRQSVQRLADVLVTEGLCEFRDNPAHRRARLLAPTDRGWDAIAMIRPPTQTWAARVGGKVGEANIRAATQTMEELLQTLDSPLGQVPE